MLMIFTLHYHDLRNSYRMEEVIPKPALLNCWKHHVGFIKSKLHEIEFGKQDKLNFILKELLIIGESQMDLYLGNVSPEQIAGEIIDQLNEIKINDLSSYKEWIPAGGKDYRLLQISDKSYWTLRIGNDTERYVHIHPARYTLNSIRVRANTLKTAIALLAWVKINGGLPYDLQTVNHVRETFLSECPIKSVESAKGLSNLVKILSA